MEICFYCSQLSASSPVGHSDFRKSSLYQSEAARLPVISDFLTNTLLILQLDNHTNPLSGWAALFQG